MNAAAVHGDDAVTPSDLRDLETERAVLGSLLARPALVSDLPADFAALLAGDAHQHIARAIADVAASGQIPDLLTVRASLQDRGALAFVGLPYLAKLVDEQIYLKAPSLLQAVQRLKQRAFARRALYRLDELRGAIVGHPEQACALLSTHGAHLEEFVQQDGASLDGGPQLTSDGLADAVDVIREGQAIDAAGVPFLLPGIIPALGILGFLVAGAKVGKTTFAQAVAAAIAMGRPFLERTTTRTRVLVIAAEDPSEYTAWCARHLDVELGWMTFYRRSLLLNASGLADIAGTVRAGGYGLVLVSSWQAVVRGLVADENDNAASCAVVEEVKLATRRMGVPLLVDAHSGKGEDQADDADPSKAMRGASAAAAAADFTLSLRFANGAFGTQRKLSGRGRFVSLEPLLLEHDPTTGEYSVLGATKDAALETVWRQITETGALATDLRSAGTIAQVAGLVGPDGTPTKTHRRQVQRALARRDGVLRSEELRHGKPTMLYRLASDDEATS